MKRSFFLFFILFLVFFSIPVKSQVNTDRVMANGRNALYFEDYILSIQYFNQVIRAKPYLAEPYLYRAMAKFNLDDYRGAESDATLCIDRNPFLIYAYQCRGASRQNLRDFKGAIEDYNKGLEYKPEDKQLLINKGVAYLQLKDYDNASQTFDLLLKYQPKFTQAYLTRGAMYAEKGDTVKALADFNEAIRLDKYYVPSYGQRGLIYFQKEEYSKALTDFNEAIRLDSRNIGYYINRGLVRYYLNDLRGSMADYDAVIIIDPNNIIARFNRGLLRAQVGDVTKAVEDFDIVIKQEPDNFMAIYNRAILKDETGNYRGAISDLDAVLKEYPNFVPGYYYRAEVKRKMKDTRGADVDYWHAYDLEQKLKKEKAQGKIITGKAVLDASSPDESVAENDQSKGNKIREKSDKNIEKFNRLVVYDKEEQQESQYKSELRGRVQDKQVKVDLEPQFVITYYEKIEKLRNISTFDKMIADYNQHKVLKIQLKITNKEAALTDDQAEYHFQSINDYSLILDRDSTNVNAYFGRALDFMVLQDLTESLRDLNKVIELNPHFAMAYFDRAMIRYKQMELDNFSSNDEDVVDLSLNIQTGRKRSVPGAQYPTTPGIQDHVLLPKDTKKAFDYELIMRDYDSVLKLNPDFVFAYFNRGNLRCMQKDFRAAILDYNEAIRRDADFAEAYYNRGLTRLYLGDTPAGIADLSKAGELGIVSAYSIIKRMLED